MTSERQRYALQVIFSVFLGLMVTAFIGVGVNTFYPQPEIAYDEQLEELYRQQEDIRPIEPTSEELTPAEEKEIEELRDEIRTLEDERQEAFETWARNTSIILIVLATIVMGVSLVRSEQLRIISNGLLLGGVFTMLYGTGWVIASGSSVARFAVMTFALVVTFVLGYMRFVRGRSAGATPRLAGAGTTVVSAPDVAELERRVERLERQLSGAAAILGSEQEPEDAE